jgi:hypothetical protein
MASKVIVKLATIIRLPELLYPEYRRFKLRDISRFPCKGIVVAFHLKTI